MKRILVLIIIFTAFIFPCGAETLQGGISYTVESARKIAFAGVAMKISVKTFQSHINDPDYKENQDFIKYGIEPKNRTVTVFNMYNSNKPKAYCVKYKNNPKYTYYYLIGLGGNFLNFLDIEEETNKGSKYPLRHLRYDRNGNLIGASLTVAYTDNYLYDKKGKLKAHWVGNIGYNENGKVIGKRKEIEF